MKFIFTETLSFIPNLMGEGARSAGEVIAEQIRAMREKQREKV